VAVFGIIAIAGWTRLIIEPAGVYIAYLLALVFFLVSIIHPPIIAYRLDELEAKPFNRAWVYVLWIVAFGFLCSLIAQNRAYLFGFEPFRISSVSMAPTVQPNDLVIVDTWRFRRRSPVINDLVVFDLPGNPGTKYLYRVVGMPGDTIEIREDVRFSNGAAIAEEFIEDSGTRAGIMSDFGPRVVPDDHYFVLGDNRHNARDSRFIGPIHKDLLHGRVEYRWFASDDGISWSRFPARLAADGT
jgi:signal peptidase I